MAYPFGGHPSVADFMQWARTEGGCEVNSGFDGETGKPLVRIVAPSGQHVIIAGLKQSERLEPTLVGNLNRRLGLQSPFAAMPP